jgi:hypothetical protein
VPWKGGGVADGLKPGFGVAVGDDVEPIAIAPILGYPLLVGREGMVPGLLGSYYHILYLIGQVITQNAY